jgi:hypothetical protein
MTLEFKTVRTLMEFLHKDHSDDESYGAIFTIKFDLPINIKGSCRICFFAEGEPYFIAECIPWRDTIRLRSLFRYGGNNQCSDQTWASVEQGLLYSITPTLLRELGYQTEMEHSNEGEN